MCKFMGVAILAAGLASSAGCGKAASAGENWIFYSYEESSSDGKTTTRSTVQECLNIKYVSQATYYAAATAEGKDKPSLLWMNCAGKEIKLHGKDADSIWKSLQSHN